MKKSRILAILSAVVLVVSIFSGLCFPAHAAIDAASFMYPIWHAYGAANGVNVFLVGDQAFAHDSFTGLFDDWQEFEVSHGNQNQVQSLSDFVTSYRADVAVNGTGTGAVWKTDLALGSSITTALARFWKYLLTELLGASSVTDSSFQGTSGNLGSKSGAYFINCYSGHTSQNLIDYGSRLLRTNNGGGGFFYALIDTSSPFNVFSFYSGQTIYFASTSNVSSLYYKYGNSGSVFGFSLSNFDSETGLRYRGLQLINSGDVPSSDLMSFSDYHDGLSWYSNYLANPTYSASITASPADGVDVLGFPDVDSSDYVETPDTITWNVPYDQTADLDDYLEQANEQAIENGLVVEDEMIAPPGTEVFTPLMPVALPSFNFSLSGIWHYVEDWVDSLQDFFQLLLYMWSRLPYVMVVPVYASIVILIVVGLYRRFFM